MQRVETIGTGVSNTLISLNPWTLKPSCQYESISQQETAMNTEVDTASCHVSYNGTSTCDAQDANNLPNSVIRSSESCWYTPQQFVSSTYFPFFKSSPEQVKAESYRPYNIRAFVNQGLGGTQSTGQDYVINSQPSLDELLLPPIMTQHNQHQFATPEIPNQQRMTTSVRFKLKNKRKRTAFTTEQLEYLEHVYSKQIYIAKPERENLTKLLGLSDRSVKVWFQNRRMKNKKCNQDEYNENQISSSSTSPPQAIKQIQIQLQQCEVVDNIVNVSPDICQKLGDIINIYLPKNIVDCNTNSLSSTSSIESSLPLKPAIESDIMLSTADKNQNNEKDNNTNGNIEESEEMLRNEVQYEAISPPSEELKDGSPWMPKTQQEMQELFERHFC